MNNFVNRRNCYLENTSLESKLPIPPKSVKILFQENYEAPVRFKKPCHVKVFSEDSVDCGNALKTKGYRPLVLNMADNSFPGGGWHMGCGAQEEAIFYRSNYFMTLNLDTGFYPIDNAVGIYSENVTVFRNRALQFTCESKLDFVAVAAIKNPKLVECRLSNEDRRLTERKLELIFQIACEKGHDSLVLSAIGCGAFFNPKNEIVDIFNQLITKYERTFQMIIFAIIPKKDVKDRYITKETEANDCNFSYFYKHIRNPRNVETRLIN